MKSNLIVLLCVVFSCTSDKQNNDTRKMPIADSISIENTATNDTVESDTEIIATFSDSLNIGEKGKCKIELVKHRVFDDAYVIIKFFFKRGEYWQLQNTYLYELPTYMDFAVDISDYNNDNFNDITFISAIAARGGNEVRRLFVYDDDKREIISIVNSEDYPNMQYNKELDCIDAFMIHGASTNAFARIVGDSLKTFAFVDNNMDFHTVKLVDKNGNEKELYKVKSKGVYIRFKNYKPLIEYP